MKFIKGLFGVIAIVALSYSGWSYLDQFWYQRRSSESFDEARKARAGQISIPAKTIIARLKVPRLRITTMVEEGVGNATLRRAAGHIPHTALPGRAGNVGVAAHRDTLFRGLKGIRKRDRIVLSTLARDYNYEVTSISIVNPEDTAVLAPSPGKKTLTLVTCYPFNFIGDAPKRFIVRARQTSEITFARLEIRK